MKARDIPNAIQWHEGMLLTPEHFQQMNARHEMLVGYGLSCAPYQWGVQRFDWDTNLLASGLLSVTELEAILPDGLVTTLESPGDLKLELKPYAEQMKQGPVPVCLVVPARKAVTAEGDLERYESFPGRPDANHDSGSPNGIPRMRPRLSLLPGPIPPKYVGFPLLRVRYENEVFTASPDYPVLTVPVSSRLGNLCSLVARHIREKATYLADRARVREDGAGQQSESEAKRLIHSLVGALPAFEGALYAGLTHPYPLYLALCSLAGSIATVGLSLVPPVFAPYNHNHPYASFEEVKNYIFQAIAEGISETWAAFRFQREGDLFVLSPKTGWSEWLAGARRPGQPVLLVMGLRGPSGCSEKEMQTWGTSCIVGSKGVVPSLVSRRILGVSRRPVESVDDLIPGKGLLLFELDADPAVLLADEDLQVFDRRAGAVLPAEVLLFVRKGTK
jgi:type VI secretion system protein ImpJ